MSLLHRNPVKLSFAYQEQLYIHVYGYLKLNVIKKMHIPLDTELVKNIKGGWGKKRGGGQNKSRSILDRITLDQEGVLMKYMGDQGSHSPHFIGSYS